MLPPSGNDAAAGPVDQLPPRSTREAAAPLSIAVLCGGASRRMGTDKALLSLRPGAPPLLALVINNVRDLTDDLFLVGVSRPGYERFGVSLVQDHYPGAGPLGAIATALTVSRHNHCLVVACDMPFLNADLLRWIAALPRDHFDALVPVLPEVTSDGSPRLVPQPLHAVYSRQCLPAIQRRLEAGERRATAFHADVRVTTLTPDQFGNDEAHLRSFCSVDTPAVARLARMWLPD